MRIIFYRTLTAAFIALIFAVWFFPVSGSHQQMLMLITATAAIVVIVLQIGLTFSRLSEFTQWLFQYSTDVLLVILLIIATGGELSPFSFLLGLVIIASGIHARRILPIFTSILACMGYLMAVYIELWRSHHSALNEQQALHVLMQVSALMLVGGVMAYIARRHANLSASSDKAVQQHRKLKDLHDKMMAEMREGVVLLDQQLRLIDMNNAASIMLKRDTLISLLAFKPLRDFFAQQEKQHDMTAFQCEYNTDDQALLLAVRQLYLEKDSMWLLTIVDMSEIRGLQNQLLQQEKMAALGQMAAMLAHEIRNPIQTMAQGLEIMAKSPANAAQMQHVFHDEMMRLNRLVSMMLQYSKPWHATPVMSNVVDLIEASLQQINAHYRADVQWQTEIDELYLDSDHFRLVLDNLLSNALANRSDSDSSVELMLTRHEQSWILAVSNQGDIAASIRDKLFDPFVSGRPAGVGLGLATVQQVCLINGWLIDVTSAHGITCFHIRGTIHTPASNIKAGDWDKEARHG